MADDPTSHMSRWQPDEVLLSLRRLQVLDRGQYTHEACIVVSNSEFSSAYDGVFSGFGLWDLFQSEKARHERLGVPMSASFRMHWWGSVLSAFSAYTAPGSVLLLPNAGAVYFATCVTGSIQLDGDTYCVSHRGLFHLTCSELEAVTFLRATLPRQNILQQCDAPQQEGASIHQTMTLPDISFAVTVPPAYTDRTPVRSGPPPAHMAPRPHPVQGQPPPAPARRERSSVPHPVMNLIESDAVPKYPNWVSCHEGLANNPTWYVCMADRNGVIHWDKASQKQIAKNALFDRFMKEGLC